MIAVRRAEILEGSLRRLGSGQPGTDRLAERWMRKLDHGGTETRRGRTAVGIRPVPDKTMCFSDRAQSMTHLLEFRISPCLRVSVVNHPGEPCRLM
jgi:hypothetical protein